MKCVEVYKELYHQEPFDVAFCPYRISPLGAHIDHQYGKINGLAIDKGIHMAYHPKQNGVVELQSLNFPKRAQFFVSAVPDEKQGDWADHLRGAAKMLGEKYRLKVGLSGIIEGSLPIGGLSSSASVIICFLSALCKVNGIHLKPMEMILTAKAAENQYVGVSCGKLDQSCEVLSKKNHLLYLDTKDDSYELIPTSEKMKPYKVAIFFSGLERSLKNSKYNLRQDECKAAAYALMGYAGIGINKIGSLVYRSEEFVRKVFYKILRESVIKSSFGSCGKNVHIAEKSDIKGIGNISIGDDVAIGPHALLWTTRANIIIKEKVIIGPGLSIITGDHKMNAVGKYMADVTDEEKDDENDQDVIIEKDVWIGANVTILKGVTVAEGCVIGAGTVLTKSTHPYGIYVGVPGRRVSERFTNEELEDHINILQEKSKW